jgi:hypothetical protein
MRSDTAALSTCPPDTTDSRDGARQGRCILTVSRWSLLLGGCGAGGAIAKMSIMCPLRTGLVLTPFAQLWITVLPTVFGRQESWPACRRRCYRPT